MIGYVKCRTVRCSDESIGPLEAVGHSDHLSITRPYIIDMFAVLSVFLVTVVRVGEINAALGINP